VPDMHHTHGHGDVPARGQTKANAG
jgi:hypothetical protein